MVRAKISALIRWSVKPMMDWAVEIPGLEKHETWGTGSGQCRPKIDLTTDPPTFW